MKVLKQSLFICFLLLASRAEARVFSFQNNWVAAYFRGSGGMSMLSDDAYADSSGSATRFSDEVAYNYSGELGFAFLLSDTLTLRAGFEGVQGQNMDVEGKQSNGTKLMDVTSKVVATNPNICAELIFGTGENSRYFAFAGAGYAKVRVSNDYVLTNAGDTLYFGAPGANDYSESAEGTSISYEAGLGYEMYAFDNVTFIFDLGYRIMKVSELTYTGNASTVNTVAVDGQTFYDNNGSKMALDMSGPFIGMHFRFYVPPLD